MDTKEFLFVEKYRPNRIEDCILPTDTKASFAKFVEQKNIPNLLLIGTPGIGKTTVAKAMIHELGSDCIVINGSLDRNMDMLRDRVAQFVSSVSFADGRKYVIIDEADGLSPLVQPALRAFMEEFSHNAGFILTANHVSKIVPALRSRCSEIDFQIKATDRPKMAMAFMKRAEGILTQEGIEYDKKALAALIQKYFPDWRRALNELQLYSSHGKIDTGILANLEEVTISELIGFLKRKEFSNVRKWIAENADQSSQTLFRKFYDQASDLFTPSSVPEVVLILAKYGYQSNFSVDQEINTAAAFVELMLSASWKE